MRRLLRAERASEEAPFLGIEPNGPKEDPASRGISLRDRAFLLYSD